MHDIESQVYWVQSGFQNFLLCLKNIITSLRTSFSFQILFLIIFYLLLFKIRGLKPFLSMVKGQITLTIAHTYLYLILKTTTVTLKNSTLKLLQIFYNNYKHWHDKKASLSNDDKMLKYITDNQT